VACNLANWRKPDNVSFYHYIDDLLLASDLLEAVRQAVDSLTTYLQGRGWAINPEKVQGLGLSIKFLGIVWSGKTKVLPSAVIDKVHAFPVPTTSKQLQEVLRNIRILVLLYTSSSTAAGATVQTQKKEQLLDWGRMEQDAFQQAKLAVKQVQALRMFGSYSPSRDGRSSHSEWLWLGHVVTLEVCSDPQWSLGAGLAWSRREI